jgi:ATP-dependent DNA helicase RecG
MEPVYSLSEGLTNNRMRELAGQALGRVPELAEWIEPSVLRARGWQAGRLRSTRRTAILRRRGARAARL